MASPTVARKILRPTIARERKSITKVFNVMMDGEILGLLTILSDEQGLRCKRIPSSRSITSFSKQNKAKRDVVSTLSATMMRGVCSLSRVMSKA
jgi:hypothetical protein